VSAALSPADRLDRYIAEDRLIRGKWLDYKGRACLLVALAPECGTAHTPAVCPASVIPPWLAYLTPWLDDAGSLAAWPAMVRRYARLAHRWHVLTPETWRRLDYAARAICVREAVRHTTNAQSIEACETVIALCDRAASGDQPVAEAWAAAAAAAKAVAAAEAEAGAAWAAAKAVAGSAAEAARAGSAAEAARAVWSASAAWAAGAAWAAARAAAWAAAAVDRATSGFRPALRRPSARAAAAAVDRITAAVLGAIEAACTAAEVQS
jgi:hypothetical protein